MIRLALGWTILHSLWEGAIVALVLAAALSILRASRARYAAACLAMLGILAAFGLTLARVIQTQVEIARIPHPPLSPAPLDGWDAIPGIPAQFSASGVLPWIAPVWIAGVIAFHLYSLLSWWSARRMLHRGVCLAPDRWQQRLSHFRGRLHLSIPVTLLESSLAGVPVVIGYLRPVILAPVGMLVGMPPSQIDAILLHELAHIRRRDYLVNLLQTIVEGFLFYHPAIWWIASVIRSERENCCDDLAVAFSGDAHEYASALAALEESRWAVQDAALAATGGNLMKRIRRLLYPLEAPRTTLTPVLSAAILTLTVALGLTAWQSKTAPPDTPYTHWVKEDVAYIIDDRERAAFKALQTDDEREMFIEQFWLRRDPTPGTARNEFKEEHYRRIAYANDHFPSSIAGWKTDRGRIYIVYGPPDEIESHPAGGQGRAFPYEQWLYHHIANIGDNVIIEFDDPDLKGEYRMQPDPHQ